VRSVGANTPKIVPRLVLEGWNQHDYRTIFGKRKNIDAFVAAIKTEWRYAHDIIESHVKLTVCSKYSFNGLVLDMAGIGPRHFHAEFLIFIKKLSETLHADSMELILVIPVTSLLFTRI